MEKVERDGEVAVLVSRLGCRYGDPCPEHETLCMDARLVNAALEGDQADIPNRLRLMEEVQALFPQRDDLTEWARYVEIRWVPKGLVFRIVVYDDYIDIHPFNPREYLVA